MLLRLRMIGQLMFRPGSLGPRFCKQTWLSQQWQQLNQEQVVYRGPTLQTLVGELPYHLHDPQHKNDPYTAEQHCLINLLHAGCDSGPIHS
jgi:hypothetical protein